MTTTPRTRVRTALLPAGPVRLMSLAGGEIEPVRQVFAGLSPASRWLRFHTGMPSVPERYLRQLATVVPGERHVVVALAGGEAVGHGEFTRERGEPARAEIALAVHDSWHGRGVGLALISELAALAAALGIDEFTCSTLPENTPVRAWLRRCGATVHGDGVDFRFGVAALLAAVREHGPHAVAAHPPAGAPRTESSERSTACA